MTAAPRPTSPGQQREDTDRWLIVHLAIGSLGIALVVVAVVFTLMTFPHPDHARGTAPAEPAAARQSQP